MQLVNLVPVAEDLPVDSALAG
eukprot:COSAG01_NODE_55567_length_324_cov_0.693333_2_plen_21_part_01